MGFAIMSGGDRRDRGAGADTHAAALGGEPEQLGLLPAEGEAARDRLLPLAEAAKSRSEPKGSGGRPLGARNRRTDLMAAYLIDRYGDPLEGHVALGMMPLRELIPALRKIASDCGMKLDLSVKELLHLQADLRKEALPYIHAKRAPETAQGDPVLPVIGLGVWSPAGVGAPGGRSIEDAIEVEATISEVEQKQGDSDGAGE